jgi:uncharacterized protein UPF0175
MEVILNIPDNIAILLQTNGESVSQVVLEALAIEGYASGKLSEGNVMDLLGIGSKEELHEFFADSRLMTGQPTSLEEFERDMDALAEGLDHLSPLPRDFSRADIYDDHN